jgi:Zn-dependent oligopeptidase
MHLPNRLLRLIPALLLPAALLATGATAAPTLADFQATAARHHVALELPNYPRTPDEVRAQAAAAIKAADDALAALAARPAAELTFANTFGACDEITAKVTNLYQVISTIAEASTEKAMRDTANETTVKLQEWSVGLDYREPLYRALKAFADTKPTLAADEQRLVDEQMRSYRRAGLALPPADRAAVEQLRKDLAALTTKFAVNINEARAPLDFTAVELGGMPQSFLDSPGVKQADGRYRVLANVTWHAQAVAENADSPEVRRRVLVARSQLARDTNVAVLTKLVALRADIARRLGYATWADYQTETRMVKSGTAAVKFEEDLVTGLQPKFAAEMETLRQLKAAHTGNPAAQIEAWDIGYYTNKLMKERYAVDTEKLRVYFPYQATLEGMFAIYQKIFGLKFTAVRRPTCWPRGCSFTWWRTPPRACRWARSTSTCFRARGSSTTSRVFRRRPAACSPTGAMICPWPRCCAIFRCPPPRNPRCSSTATSSRSSMNSAM